MAQIFRGEEGRVGFAELFFDLVFVFAITQVSHHLLHHFTLHGALEVAVMLLAVWWVWIYSTWVLNRLDPEVIAVRFLLFGLMGLELFLSMSIPRAFEDRGLVFALAFVGMQLGRSLFVWHHAAGMDMLRRTYLRIILWFVASALFWIAGAFAAPEQRLPFWAVAIAIEYLGPIMGYWLPLMGRDATQNWEVKGGHMAERCGLFVIICLGETLLVSGATFAEMDWAAPGLRAFVGSLVLSIAMWWVYFHIGHHRGAHQIETSADPGRVARLSFTYAHIPIVAGIVMSAVGCERVIAHPDAAGHLGDILVLMGGNLLFLLGNGWFKGLSGPWFPLSHSVGLGLTVLAGIAAFWLPLEATMALAAAILIVVAIWEHRSIGGARHH